MQREKFSPSAMSLFASENQHHRRDWGEFPAPLGVFISNDNRPFSLDYLGDW
jgi:hypothetical protein